VEINKALAIIQNEIDVPSGNRRARYIIKKYRAPLADHGLIRNHHYARRFGKRGVCFFFNRKATAARFTATR